ncbi:hypothetical protein B7G68_03725 [Caulobacter segnis]|uniref:Uncharacterized protein n=2 Tax=Caulobacter segnis TaxID=88688 RepID=D5VHY3_CAUST|nr:hypothetical protein [Caulobacter segnis]ADG09236.1 hypothetical protein Cseg_0729 [Caulobacter segnis ATCC 21756]AVQ01050.1 hypothetical protein B7G68_03725 [Caulobacter segnis]
MTVRPIAVFVAAVLSIGSVAKADQQAPIASVDLGFAHDGSLGPFYYIGGVSSRVDLHASARLARLEAPAIARMTDGGWARWKVQDPFAETLSLSWIQAVPKAAGAPDWAPPPGPAPAPPQTKGAAGCRWASFSTRPLGRFLGLLDCKGESGSVLATLGDADKTGARPVVKLASMKMRFDAIDITLSRPHSDGAVVVLAAYDPKARRFDYVQLFWPSAEQSR